MRRKILAFVYDGKRFLTLRNNPEDPTHGGDYWFTVTGSVEGRESYFDAVNREVKEETNLEVTEIFDLKWGSVYSWGGEEYKERNYLAFVKRDRVILNEEHVDFEWLSLKKFVKRIVWGLAKSDLEIVLKRALQKREPFKRCKLEDLRKKLYP